jgi:hypothetical protein
MKLSEYTAQNTKGIEGLSNQLCGEARRMGFLRSLNMTNLSIDSDSLVHPFLSPNAATSLTYLCGAYAIRKPGEKIIVSTCYRTLAQQFILKQNLPTLVAPVGRSDHGSGRSIDLVNWTNIDGAMKSHGWTQSYPSNDPVHFDFGDATDYRQTTILCFQRLYNKNTPELRRKISEDGVCGQRTLEALGNSPVDGFFDCSTPRFLRVGAVGKDVGAVQFLLKIKADGEFGEGTSEAVKDFQTEKGLPSTGIVDTQTWEKLKRVV